MKIFKYLCLKLLSYIKKKKTNIFIKNSLFYAWIYEFSKFKLQTDVTKIFETILNLNIIIGNFNFKLLPSIYKLLVLLNILGQQFLFYSKTYTIFYLENVV